MILKFLQQGIGQTITSETVLNDEIPYHELGPNFKRDFYFLSQPTYQVDALNELKRQLHEILKQIRDEQKSSDVRGNRGAGRISGEMNRIGAIERDMIAGIDSGVLSADGLKILYQAGSQFGIVGLV